MRHDARSSAARALLKAGAAGMGSVLALGALATTGPVTSADLHADTGLSHFGTARSRQSPRT